MATEEQKKALYEENHRAPDARTAIKARLITPSSDKTSSRKMTSADIDAQVAEFYARGGQKTVIPTTVYPRKNHRARLVDIFSEGKRSFLILDNYNNETLCAEIDEKQKGFIKTAKRGEDYRFTLTQIVLDNGFDHEGELIKYKGEPIMIRYRLEKEAPRKMKRGQAPAFAAAANDEDGDQEQPALNGGNGAADPHREEREKSADGMAAAARDMLEALSGDEDGERPVPAP